MYFGKTKSLSRKLLPFWDAYALWLRLDCVDLSAAFAYHTIQAFFPALLIALAFASRLLGNDEQLVAHLVDRAQLLLPVDASIVFEDTLARFTRQALGAGVLGALLLLISANNIYLTLQRGADRIWWNRPFGVEKLAWYQVVRRFVLLRIKASLLLILIGMLFVLDQLISNLRFLGFVFFRQWLVSKAPEPLIGLTSVSFGVDLLLSLMLSFFAALVLYWFQPSKRIPVGTLVPGAMLASGSITVLNLLLGRVLIVLGLRFQAYGVVGGVLVLMLWIWLVGVLLYYGQCFSVVWSRRGDRGRRSTLFEG
jgi:membrane protein